MKKSLDIYETHESRNIPDRNDVIQLCPSWVRNYTFFFNKYVNYLQLSHLRNFLAKKYKFRSIISVRVRRINVVYQCNRQVTLIYS